MADRDSATRRQRNLATYHRRVADRRERGLCIKCGKCPPAPEHNICASCGEQARAADRARAARLRAEGKPVRDPEARRRADRERGRRQHAERRAAGLCVKCGRVPALPERTQCEPCAERRLAADRARHARARAEGKTRRDSEAARLADRERGRRRRAERRAAGLCIRCGNIPPEEGRSMCEPCRDDRRAAKRARRAERRAAGLCETCAAPVNGGAAYCGPCAAARNERRQRHPEAHREADRRRYAERRARGDCTRCGKPANGAAECHACRDAARARYDARRAAGVCVKCQTPTVGGAACSAPCAGANVGQRDREAENAARRQRYQDGLPGRRKHAARQRRYRDRQRCEAAQSEACGRKVTHHPSTRQHRRVVVPGTPKRRRGTRPFGDEEPPGVFRCSICGRFCAMFVHPGLRTVRHPAREG